MHSCALERASARGRAEEHEARGPLVDASGHGGELGDETEVWWWVIARNGRKTPDVHFAATV